MIKLSVIIPFYNVEPYIEECIRSVYNQDIPHEEYEVICVDDCSTDGSRPIVERLQQEYPTLQLLSNPRNMRQGAARNKALDVARGEYVLFIDSDDTIQENVFAYLLGVMDKERLDIFDCECGGEMGDKSYQPHYTMGVCTGTEYIFDDREQWNIKCCNVCTKVFRKSLFDELHLRFYEEVQYEDNDFSIRAFANAHRVLHTTDRWYQYREVQTSTMHQKLTLRQIFYASELLKRYIDIVDELKCQPIWVEKMKGLIVTDTYEIFKFLNNVTIKERWQFYLKGMGRIPGIGRFVSTKSQLALRFPMALKLFYKNL